MSTVDVFDERKGNPDDRTIHWPVHVGFAVALIAFYALYAQTWASLISIWGSTGRYEYAFLIFPVSAVLVWLRRDQLKQIPATPAPLGLVALAILCLVWLAGAAAYVNLVTQFVIIVMLPCLVFTFYGKSVTRTLIFPLCYLLFAVPFGNFLVGPLQDITARLSVAALQWTPVPVFLDGRFIMTPSSTWHVAEACSGVSFFFATTAFGVLYANLFFRSWGRRLIFVALAVVAPVIANGLRVFFTILIGEYFGMQYATGTDHMIFGWQFFGTVMVLLFLVGFPWHEQEAAVAAEPVPSKSSIHRSPGGSKTLGVTVIALLLLAAPPVWMGVNASPDVFGTVQPLELPQTLGNLALTESIATDSKTAPGTQFRNPDVAAHARYGTGERSVKVITATYGGGADPDDEMVAFGNRLFDSSVWKIADSNETSVGAFHELQLVRRHGQGRWVLWYFYRVGSKAITSTSTIKFWQAWNRLLGRAVTTQVVVLSTRVLGQDEIARNRLKITAEGLLRRMQSSGRMVGQP